jgi:hypothetical protein
VNSTSDLFLAILAMDAYNRTGSLGTPQNLVLPDGTRIGNVNVLTPEVGGVLEDRSSGFFAQVQALAAIILWAGALGAIVWRLIDAI